MSVPDFHFSQNIWRMGWIVRQGLTPLLLSVVVMSVGCPLGVPLRFPFDAVNLTLLVSFMVSVQWTFQGEACGLHRYGLAWPRWGQIGWRDVRSVLIAAFWVAGPAALAVILFTLAIRPIVLEIDNIVVTVLSRIGPMYMVCAVWAWLIHQNMQTKRGPSVSSL